MKTTINIKSPTGKTQRKVLLFRHLSAKRDLVPSSRTHICPESAIAHKNGPSLLGRAFFIWQKTGSQVGYWHYGCATMGGRVP